MIIIIIIIIILIIIIIILIIIIIIIIITIFKEEAPVTQIRGFQGGPPSQLKNVTTCSLTVEDINNIYLKVLTLF